MASRKKPLPPDDEILAQVQAVLDRSPEPVPSTKVASELKSVGLPAKQWPEFLQRQAEAGKLHRFSPLRGTALRYWTRDLAAYARHVCLAAFAKGPQSAANVEKAMAKPLKELSKAQRQEVLDRLVREKMVFELPKLGGSKTRRYSTSPPDPREYVAAPAIAFRKKLDEVVRLLAAFGIPREQIVGAALDACGMSDARPLRPIELQPIAPSPAIPASEFPSRFDAAFADLDRQKGSHNLVSLVDLRRALACFTREQFDAGLRELRLAGRYGLSAAESVHGVRPEERAAGVEEAGTLLLHVSKKL